MLIIIRKTIFYLLMGLLFSVICVVAGDREFFISKKTLDFVVKTYGPFAGKRVEALRDLMNELQDEKDEMVKLERVNDFFNRVPYKNDYQTWGKEDYWASRIEFLGKDAGDCEDYSIAKYFTLKQLGVPAEKMFLTYAKSITYKQAHMVLTYFEKPKSVPLVLGNYNKKILPATERKDLIPIFSFRGDTLYLAQQRGLGKVVPAGKKITDKWDELMNRIRSTEQ